MDFTKQSIYTCYGFFLCGNRPYSVVLNLSLSYLTKHVFKGKKKTLNRYIVNTQTVTLPLLTPNVNIQIVTLPLLARLRFFFFFLLEWRREILERSRVPTFYVS